MRLPEINQTQAAPLRSSSPQLAVSKAAGKQDIQQQIYKLGDTIGEIKAEHDVTMATAEYTNAITDYKKRVADMAYATKDELAAMGILDQVDIQDADGNDMEAIPKWKWYAIGLEKTMNANLDVRGRRIASRQVRDKWETAVRENNQRELEAALIDSGNEAVKSEIEMAEVEYKNAVSSGQYDTARLMLHNSPLLRMNPALVKQRELELNQAEEIGSIYERFETMDTDIIEETLDYMSSEEYLNSSVLSVEKRRQVRDVGYSRLVSLNAAQTKARKEAGDMARMDLEIAMYTDPGSFDPREIERQKNVLGQDNVTALLKGWNALSGGDGKTESWVMPTFQSMMYDLEFGSIPDGMTYQDKYEAAVQFVDSQRVEYDRETGKYRVRASGQDLATMNRELARLRDEPQTNIRFKEEYKALEKLILRYDSNNPFSPEPSSTPAFLEAVASLKAYVEREGPKADIDKWHRENVPKYLVDEARAQFYKLPTQVRRYSVPSASGKIDGAKTQQKFDEAYANLIKKIETGNKRDREEAEQQLTALEKRMAAWDEYRNGVGAAYVEY